ncbi:MAG TPA: zinc-binding alcohol dehydrogenase family protein [Chitinophagaceae bacterium]|nr:zinc-binding alcohol dehydrogenase family protein [Chitinophagaceae bacterium]
MQQLVCTEPGRFEYRTVPEPTLNTGESIVRIRKIGVCGTDIHAFDGTQPYFSYPRVLGHELAVEFVEGDAGFKAGELLTVMPYISCGKCVACRKGKTNCCVNIKVLGVHTDGGMTEYLSLPSYTLLRAEGLKDDELGLVEPLAIGAHGVSRASIQPGEHVLIIGAGPIGLGTMAFARIAGGHVIAADVNEQRLAFCRDELHVPYTLNAKDAGFLDHLQDITRGDMPTVVIDATGNLSAINNAFQYLAHTGRYVLIGLQRGDIIVNHPEFHKREATLMSSRNATVKDFEYVISCIREEKLFPSSFITSRLNFSQVADLFSNTVSDPNNIKTMIQFHD